MKGIDHLLLLVDGLEPAIAFYERVLGARLETRLPKYAMAELRAGASQIDLVDTSVPEGAWARPPVAGGRNLDHVGVRVSGCDEATLRRHLAMHGARIVEERVNEERGGRSLSLYVRDPSGNVVELMGEPS
jgi:glyoxylase I family protein